MLLFFWQFIMCYSKAGMTPWMAQVDQHWTTHLLPPSLPALFYGVFPFSCSAAQTPTCSPHPYLSHDFSARSTYATVCLLLHCVNRWGHASAAQQVLPALEYNQRFLWVVRFFVCSFYLVDQQSLLNSPLLRKINRIFAKCNVQYKIRS